METDHRKNNLMGTDQAEITPDMVMSLVDELDRFKRGKDFQFFGLGLGGPAGEWILEAEKAARVPGNTGLAATQLIFLAREYLKSKGFETGHTKHFRGLVLELLGQENFQEKFKEE